jgi:hypothetical protein
LIGALFFQAFILFRFIFDKMEAPRGALRQYNAEQTSSNASRLLASKRCSCKFRTITTCVRVKIDSTSTRPSRFALCSANASAKVLDRRRPRRKWLELDALSPIADNADSDYTAILDCGNLKDVEVLNELVRKSVVPARHYVNTKIFGECINQVR